MGKLKKIMSIFIVFCMIISNLTPIYAAQNTIISGYVWEDSDEDGMMDSDEKRIAGITVYLDRGNPDNLKNSAQSGPDGYYEFDTVPGKANIIEVDEEVELKNKGYKLTNNNGDSKVNQYGVADKIKPASNIHIGLIKYNQDNSTSGLMYISRNTNATQVKSGESFDINYTITPKPIPVSQDTSKKDIILVIDTSGSMDYKVENTKKIETMKEVAKKFIDKFSDSKNFNIGIVEYSNYARKASNGIISVSSEQQRTELKGVITGLKTGGGTNIGDGIRTAVAMLEADTSAKEKYIILMTDGVATAYNKGYKIEYKTEEKWVKVNSKWKKITEEVPYEVYSDNYMGSEINSSAITRSGQTGSSYKLNEYISYIEGNGQDLGTKSLNYAKNLVEQKIKGSNDIKKFFVVGFSSGAGSSNLDIANAAGTKGSYSSAKDSNVLQNLYDTFANQILTSISGKIHFEENITSQSNAQIGSVLKAENLPEGLNLNENKIVGDMNVTYTLNNEKTFYTAQPVTFKIKYTFNKQDMYTFGQNKTSLVKMDTLNNTDTKYFEPPITVEIKDKPKVPTFTQNPETWTNQNVTVNIAYSDDSIKKEYKIGSEPWQTYSGAITITNNTVIQARGIDILSQQSIGSANIINIDNISPTGNISTKLNASQNEELILIANDDLSGVKRVQNPDGTWIDGNTITYTAVQNGQYTFKIEDNAGNIGTAVATVNNILSKFPKTSIKIYDSEGFRDSYEKDSTEQPSRIDKILPNALILKGNSIAQIDVRDDMLKSVRYKFINSNEKPEVVPPDGELIDITNTIKEETIYPDLIKDKVGYLKARSYDVSHLGTLSDQNKWNDASEVFKNPSSLIEDRPTNIASTNESYITKQNGSFKNFTIFMNKLKLGTNVGGPYDDYKEASKFWEYITPDETGDYYFGTISDDGSKGYIIIDSEKVQIVDQFKIQGSTFKTDNNKMYLEKGKYYPIYLQYSNWGGEAQFRLLYKKGNKFSTTDNSSLGEGKNVPADWFRPTTNTEPGEISTSTFESTAIKGVPFPEETANYYIAIRAENASGKIREVIYGPFMVDKTPPTGVITLDPSEMTNKDVKLTLTGSDADSGVKRVQNPDGTWVDGNSTTYTVTENGTYTFKVEDNAGNIATIEQIVTNIDKIPPQITITTPIMTDNIINAQEQKNVIIKGTTKLDKDIDVTIIIKDSNGKEVETTVKSDMNGEYTAIVDVSGLKDGKLTIKAVATDKAANQGEATASVEKDTEGPSVTITTPIMVDNKINKEEQNHITITGTTEPNTKVTVTITDASGKKVEATVTSDVNGNYSVTVDGSRLEDGDLTVKAIATDELGNKGEEAVKVVIKDTVPPNVTITTPIMGDNIISNTEKSNVTITGTTEANTKVTVTITDVNGKKVEITVTSDANGNYSASGLDASGLADGNLTVKATAEDEAGNKGEATKTVTNMERSEVVTGTFINNKFEVKDTIQIVKGFNSNIAVKVSHIENTNSVEVKTDNISAVKFADAKDIKIYDTDNLSTPITNYTATSISGGFKVEFADKTKEYLIVFNATANKDEGSNKAYLGDVNNKVTINGTIDKKSFTIKIIDLPKIQ